MLKKVFLGLVAVVMTMSMTACNDVEGVHDKVDDEQSIKKVCTNLDNVFNHTVAYIEDEIPRHCDECVRYDITGWNLEEGYVRVVTYHADGNKHYVAHVDVVK